MERVTNPAGQWNGTRGCYRPGTVVQVVVQGPVQWYSGGGTGPVAVQWWWYRASSGTVVVTVAGAVGTVVTVAGTVGTVVSVLARTRTMVGYYWSTHSGHPIPRVPPTLYPTTVYHTAHHPTTTSSTRGPLRMSENGKLMPTGCSGKRLSVSFRALLNTARLTVPSTWPCLPLAREALLAKMVYF